MPTLMHYSNLAEIEEKVNLSNIKKWKTRKKDESIGRIHYIPPV